MKRIIIALLLVSCGKPAEPPPPIVKTRGGEEMVHIPAGGKHESFLMDRYEVTQEMFHRLKISNPAHFKGAKNPVDNITWVEAALFCNARSVAEGLEPCYDEETAECDPTKSGYRLPTEAEWEYACRAGTKGKYSFDSKRIRLHAWFKDNSGKKTHPVGTKKPNPWGLYDMHGNVAEWCNDPYDEEMFVVRGGAWDSGAELLQSAARDCDRPGFGDACLAPDRLGFRCVRRP